MLIILFSEKKINARDVMLKNTNKCDVEQTEHKTAVRRGDRRNRITVYVKDQDHRVDWKEAWVIDHEVA